MSRWLFTNENKRRIPGSSFGAGALLVLGLLLFTVLSGLLTAIRPGISSAAPSSTLTFQARLLNTSGSLVADGTYNVEFKIYDSVGSGASTQGVCSLNSSSDDCWWLETRTGANKVTVKNGYVYANLGSVTAFSSTIPWDQELWITMNIGGTGAPGWDGEMAPRFKVAAVPYAFAAAKLQVTDSTFTNKLVFATPATSNKTITLPNETGTVCTTGSVCAGYQASGAYLTAEADTLATVTGRGATTATASTFSGGLNATSAGTGLAVTNNATVGGTLIVTGIGTFSTGLTVTTGAVNITGTSGALTLSGLGASSISTGASALTVTSSNFNTTATGINSTAIGATTTSTGAFTTLSATGTTTLVATNASGAYTQSGAGANTFTGATTISGNAILGLTGTTTGQVGFKGSTAASGTINLVGQNNPTGTRTITLPDETGTVCTTGSVCAGYQALGSYLTAEADTLATVTGRGATTATASTFSGGLNATSAGTGLAVTNNATVGGTLAVSGATATIGTASTTNGTLKLLNSTNAFGITISASAQTVGNATISFPDTLGVADTFCLSTKSNCTAIGSAGGALTGTYPSPTLAGITVQGAVPYQSASSGILASDATNFYFDGTNKRLGVGTATTGTNKLAVTSSNSDSGQLVSLTNTSGTQVAGVSIDRNGGGGTTTSLLSLSNTAGTATNGILFTGTIGTDITTAATRTLNVTTGTTGTLTLDTGTTGAINIGTNANAKTLTVGNGSDATQLVFNTGTGGINLGSNGVANTLQIGNTTGAVAQTINIGNNATASSTNNVLIGSTIAGTTTLQNSTTINLNAGTIVGNATTQNLFNTTATTVNAFGASTATILGATTGTTTIRNNLLSLNAATGTTGTTEAVARTNVTTVTLTAAGAFANNDVIFLNNAGQDYYTRIVSGGGTTTLTVSPAVSYDISTAVTKYTAQNIGATTTDYTTQANRFFQGYFTGGVVVGAGSTTLSDQNLTSTGALYVKTGGENTRLTVDSSGNVGIGDTTPASLLTVGASDAFQVSSSGAITSTSTGTALTLSGAATTGISISNTGVTTDIRLQNGETIDNNVDGTIKITGSLDFSTKLLEDGVEILASMVTAFPSACPTGWTEYTAARGRYIVGTPSGGTDLATVGTALTNSENRPTGAHTHPDSSHAHGGATGGNGVGIPAYNNYDLPNSGAGAAGWGYAVGANPGGHWFNTFPTQSATTSTPTSTGTSGVAGTNAPYIQMKYCQKTAGSDLAEWTNTNDKLTPGMIVSIDRNDTEKVTSSKVAYDETASGVVSTEPGWTLGPEAKDKTGQVQLALTGRVPTLVSTINGDIKAGDPITSSDIPGIGMKATKSGTIIGRAMENLKADEDGRGMVTILLNTTHYEPGGRGRTIGRLDVIGWAVTAVLLLVFGAKLKKLTARISTTVDVRA